MESKYSIKDLEKLSGIKAHTLRAWEQRYQLIEPKRTDTNIRYYIDEHLKKILNIAVLVKSGMRISKVAELGPEELRAAVIDAGRYQGNYESQINAFKIAMLEYDEYLFDSIFNKCLIQFGTEETLSRIMGKFIQEVGLLWQAGAISVSNEHFISNLVKQKLFAIIDQTIIPQKSDKRKSYVLYLPADELHELGLLYLYYYLKKLGNRVIYLGQSVPIEYLKEVADKTQVDQFISIFTTNPHFEEIDIYFQKIGEMFNKDNYRFFLTGMQFHNYETDGIPSQVEICPDIESLKKTFIR
ncbi:MerR family transcriptional regulator [Croceimicrobium sp.]|uniref:MerR family transcriptional regulator n=1 Tax=Croceimicrobium sp. TaxID=2828340 RepID=UPI003BA9EE8B